VTEAVSWDIPGLNLRQELAIITRFLWFPRAFKDNVLIVLLKIVLPHTYRIVK
jgi:hypothetical protein